MIGALLRDHHSRRGRRAGPSGRPAPAPRARRGEHLLGEGYGGGALYPPQLNLFGYSANNPVRLLDPNGRDFGDFIAGFGETVEGSLQGIGGDILMQMSPVTALFWRSSEIAAAFAVDAFRGVIEVALTIIPGAHQFRGVVESLLQLDQYAALVQTAINDPDEEARDRARGQITAIATIAIAEALAVRRASRAIARAPGVRGGGGGGGGGPGGTPAAGGGGNLIHLLRARVRQMVESGRQIGNNPRNVRTIRSGRLSRFTARNTDLPGGRRAAESLFNALTGRNPRGGFDRVVLDSGLEVVFRGSSRTGRSIPKLEIINPMTRTFEKITFR